MNGYDVSRLESQRRYSENGSDAEKQKYNEDVRQVMKRVNPHGKSSAELPEWSATDVRRLEVLPLPIETEEGRRRNHWETARRIEALIPPETYREPLAERMARISALLKECEHPSPNDRPDFDAEEDKKKRRERERELWKIHHATQYSRYSFLTYEPYPSELATAAAELEEGAKNVGHQMEAFRQYEKERQFMESVKRYEEVVRGNM